MGIDVRDGARAAVSIGDLLRRGRDLTENIGIPTAAIRQRITRADEPPEPTTDGALTAIGRVIVAITVPRVSSANYITQTA